MSTAPASILITQVSYNSGIMKNKRLYRSREDIMVAGVLAGLAEHFGNDPTIWRLAFAVFLVITGVMPGVLLYLIAWLVIPKAPASKIIDVD